jgi:hypothetical protein
MIPGKYVTCNIATRRLFPPNIDRFSLDHLTDWMLHSVVLTADVRFGVGEEISI